MIADLAAQRDRPSSAPRGFGDVHAAFYAHPEAFHDVTTPTSSTAIQPAGVGYDEATGLGSPDWGKLASALDDLAPPTVKVTSWKREAVTNAYLDATWTASDLGGIAGYFASVAMTGTAKPVFTSALGPTRRTLRFKGSPGKTYTLTVYAADASSNLGSATSAPVALPFDDRAASVSSGWARKGNGHAYGSTVTVSAKQGATAKLVVKGSTLGVAVDFGRTNGIFLLLIDGLPVKSIDTGGATRWAVPITVTRKPGKHTIAIRVLGAHGHGTGDTVSLDGVIAR
jgi:hypothetical protein